MALSPEEQQRIYEEEKARDEAKEKIKGEKIRKGCGGCLLIIVIIFAIAYVLPRSKTPSNQGATTKESEEKSAKVDRPSRGEEGKIFVEGLKEVFVAVDEKAFDDAIDASRAGDTIGMIGLVGTGKVFLVKSNTKVLVLDPGFFKSKVRVLEGDQFGKSGWVPVEFVVKK